MFKQPIGEKKNPQESVKDPEKREYLLKVELWLFSLRHRAVIRACFVHTGVSLVHSSFVLLIAAYLEKKELGLFSVVSKPVVVQTVF